MKRLSVTQTLVGLVSLALVAFACGGTQKPSTDNPAPPDNLPVDPVAATPDDGPAPVAKDAPDEMAAWAVVKNTSGFLAKLAQYANSVQSGAGMMITPTFFAQGLGQLVNHMRIGGLDYSQPVFVLFLLRDEEPAFVVAARVADDAELRASLDSSKGDAKFRVHDGRVAIGSASALNLASDYALTKLWDQALPNAPTLTVNIAQIMARYGAQINAGLSAAGPSLAAADPMMGKVMEVYVQGFTALLNQSSHWTFALDADAKELDVHLAFIGKPDTTMASFAQAQKPASYQLLSRFAGPDSSMVFGGQVDAEPVAPAMAAIVSAVMGADKGMGPLMADWVKLMGGDMGGSMTLKDGMGFTFALGVKDTKATQALLRKWSKTLKSAKGPFTWTTQSPAFKYKGVPVDGWTFKLNKKLLPAEQVEQMEKMFGKAGMTSFMAAGNGHLVTAAGSDARNTIKKLLDDKTLGQAASAAPGSPADAIAKSVRLKESVLFYWDLAGMVPQMMALQSAGAGATAPNPTQGIAFGMGFADTTIKLRLSIPAAQIRGMQNLATP